MEDNYYLEPSKRIPVLGEYGVVVVGGGPAGCSAAICAARHGADVLLIEKEGYLGGAAVSQLVTNIWSTNGRDFQGVWHEYIHRLEEHGGVDPEQVRFVDDNDRPRFYWNVNPETVKFVWEESLSAAGVQLLYHTVFSEVIVRDNAVRGVVAETKAGRRAIYAGRVIDCTGDGIVACKAGVEWDQGDSKSPYAMACTKVFRLGNVGEMVRLSDQDQTGPDRKKLLEEGYTLPIILDGEFVENIKKQNWARPLPAPRTELRIVASRVLEVDPIDPWDMTNAEQEGRNQAMQMARFIREHIPGYGESYLLDTNSHLGVRASRRISGIARVSEQDAVEFKKYPDGVARGSWDIDIWPADSSTAPAVDRASEEYQERLRKLLSGEYYDIRYGALVAAGIDNLLVAGRCISADHLAQASLRIQQTCMATGQAAGTAAALSLQREVTPRELKPENLVAILREDRDKVEPVEAVERYIEYTSDLLQ